MTTEEKREMCRNCDTRKAYAKFDIHIDWIDCPYEREANEKEKSMTRNQIMEFELYVMDLAEECKTVEDYEKLAKKLHESIEGAILDMCMDNGIEDYEPTI